MYASEFNLSIICLRIGALLKGNNRPEIPRHVPGYLSFGDCAAECAPTRGRAIDHIGFEVDDLDAFARALEERGIELEFSPRTIDSIELKLAFFTAPAGVRVELTDGLDLY